MKRNQKEIIGWYEYTVHEYGVGINDEQYGIVTNYEPIFEGEKESDAIERVRREKMKFKKGDTVKIIENVGTWEDWGTWIEKGAVGRVIEVDEYGCWVEPVEGYEDMFLGGHLRRVLECHIELYEGGMNDE